MASSENLLSAAAAAAAVAYTCYQVPTEEEGSRMYISNQYMRRTHVPEVLSPGQRYQH